MSEIQGWKHGPLSQVIASLDTGVSVNAEDRPHGSGEIGILKTSALTGGVFRPEQNKAVVVAERALVTEPVAADSVLVSRMNTPALVGESCYVTEEWPTLFVPDRIWQLKQKDEQAVSMRWLSYVLRSAKARAHIETHATGTSGSMKNLAKGRFLDLPVDYPPVVEQRSIAQVLDTLDTTIRQTEAIIAKLKQVKQGLLHDMLTRGIDANGELRPPQSEAPHLYKASPLGWIPESWEACRIGDVGETVTGSTPPSSDPDAWGSYRPFVTPAEVIEGPGISCAERNISERGAGYVRMLPAGSTLVVCIGSTIGKVGFSLVDLCTNQQINAVIPGEMMVAEYLPLAIQKCIAQLRAMAGLQAVPIVNKTSFDSMVIPIPPQWEQAIICERLSATEARSHREEQLVAKLLHTKSGLMDDLLTGRVRVTPLLKQEVTT
jgi:type I restriction enzyme S subunit